MGPAQLQRLFRGIRYLNSRQANDNQTRRRAADAQSPLKFRITSQLRVFVHMLKESWAPTSVATTCPRLWIRNIDDHSRARRHPASYGRTHLAQDSQDSTTSQERTDQTEIYFIHESCLLRGRLSRKSTGAPHLRTQIPHNDWRRYADDNGDEAQHGAAPAVAQRAEEGRDEKREQEGEHGAEERAGCRRRRGVEVVRVRDVCRRALVRDDGASGKEGGAELVYVSFAWVDLGSRLTLGTIQCSLASADHP